MKNARIVSLLLLAASLSSALLSCGGTDNTPTADAGTQAVTAAQTEAVTEAPDALDLRMQEDDGLEDRDFGGADFHILGVDYNKDFYSVESETGDIMDDTVFRRNTVVMDRFNVNITVDVMEYSAQVSQLKRSVTAGDDAVQLFVGHVVSAGQAVLNNVFLNWYDIPNIDFSRPWWSPSNIEDLTYDGKTFLAVGDFALGALNNTYCVYFNKQVANDYDLPDIYSIVNDGKWTLDRMTELSREVYRDMNGDGTSDENDLHGFTIFVGSPVNAFLWSFGEKIAKKQADGTMALDYYNDRVVDIYQKMYDLLWVGNTTYAVGSNVSGFDTIVRTKFIEGKALFMADGFCIATDKLRDSDTEYGIIPMPKLDEAQDGYYTMVDGCHDILGVPVTVGDVEMVGTITEALNAESYKRTVPVFYDIVLKTKGSRDEESVAIIDMICDGRIFDFGYVYGGWGAAFWMQDRMNAKSADISSYYEKKHKSVDKYMDKVFTYFEEYTAE
ncbi:MAG: hypothetical protein IKZ09_01070 [Clostridia bacterium]|nr:hypothetical protein [Clostridia bacterium]